METDRMAEEFLLEDPQPLQRKRCPKGPDIGVKSEMSRRTRGVPKWDQKPSDDVQEIRRTTDRSPREAETETGIAAQLCAHPKHRKSGAEKVCPPNLRSTDRSGWGQGIQEPGPTGIRQDNI
jgi:hypothetical protein